MSDNRGASLAALLAFVAAALAAIAAGIGYFRRGELELRLVAGALFMAALGWGALRRSQVVSDGMRVFVVAIAVLVMFTASDPAVASDPPQRSTSGASDPKELERFLDGFFAEQMEKEHIPGAAFVFVKDGEIFFRKGYGFSNLERKEPVSPDKTIFRIGSISKVFTAEAVVQLADREAIDLHTDVNRYLKRVKVPATFAESVTAAQLLSHTAGFDEIRPGTQAPDQGSVLSLPDFLGPRLVRLWRPGQICMYSTYGITLAGALVEDVSGLSRGVSRQEHLGSPGHEAHEHHPAERGECGYGI